MKTQSFISRIIFTTLTIILFSFASDAQDYKDKNVELVSINSIMPVIVSQPNCPIRIDRFVFGADSDAKFYSFYEVTNISNKTIKSYRIARWYSDNTGFVGYGAMPVNGLLPKQEIGTIPKNMKVYRKDTDVPKKIAFILVTEVTFTDGTKYDAKKNLESLEAMLVESK